MEHAASPSLITLGLTVDPSSERSSIRWGLAASCALHALVIIMAMFVRFQSDSEQPFRTIDVALISLPAMPMTAPKPVPASTKKSAVVQPPQKVAPTAPPVEDTLPPLPTETASERLSESLGGAITSIVVPQKREATATPIPSQEPNLQPSEDQSPLLDTLQLPSAPPTISRHTRLQRTEPLKIPPTPTPPSTTVPKKAQATTKPPSRPSPNPAIPTPKVQPTVKPAPAIPSLSAVTPFQKTQPATTPSKTLPSPKIEETLKRNLPNIPTPSQFSNIPKISDERSPTRKQPQSSSPQISAPSLAKIPEPPRPKTSRPAQPNITETIKKLMEGLRSTTRTPVPNPIPPNRTKPSTTTTPSIKPPPSEIDQRIAKLSIPEVAPIASIKQRLQLLEVQATASPGRSASKSSPGKNRYLAMVEDTIDRQWVAPPLLLTSTPLVILKFRISRSGDISRIHIDESSGHAHYDSAAQRAVQTVNPLPPFPSDISESFFDVQYRFIKD